MLSALMGSMSSVFNSCSTLITLDVYKKLHPQASERRLVWVGRLSTGVLVALALLWIPLMRLISGQIYQYLQSVQAYISPPIAAVFLVGVLWPRANARGALAALLTGLALGTARLVAELNKGALSAGGLALAYANINFLHFAVLLFIVCTAVLVLASLTAPAPSAEKLAGLTFATTPPAAGGAIERGRGRDVFVSVVLLACVGAIWWYFA
jgi:SSS family solute:Na+ symporter